MKRDVFLYLHGDHAARGLNVFVSMFKNCKAFFNIAVNSSRGTNNAASLRCWVFNPPPVVDLVYGSVTDNAMYIFKGVVW